MHILLITRHYPPEISGGARRPFLLTEALRLQGHKVTVASPFKSNNPDYIEAPSNAINNSLRLQSYTNETAARKLTLLDNLKNFMRQWLLWPDPDIRWARNVAKALKASDLKPDWIMTTSPPESIHIAGAALSRALGRPWLAEMRDTWVTMPHRVILERSKLRAFIERRIARHALSKATAITCVSKAVMSEARNYCAPDTPELILSHFSRPLDNSKHANGEKAPIFEPTSLNLVHTGGFSLSDRRRNLGPLLEALTPLSQKRPELLLHIAGPLTDKEKDLLTFSPVRAEYHGCVSLEQAHTMQRQADGLLLYTPKDSHALPGKYAEYALAGRPILYFGGGSWLSLVEDKAMLRPLVSGLEALEKQEEIKPSNALTHLAAAERLVNFLNHIDKGS